MQKFKNDEIEQKKKINKIHKIFLCFTLITIVIVITVLGVFISSIPDYEQMQKDFKIIYEKPFNNGFDAIISLQLMDSKDCIITESECQKLYNFYLKNDQIMGHIFLYFFKNMYDIRGIKYQTLIQIINSKKKKEMQTQNTQNNLVSEKSDKYCNALKTFLKENPLKTEYKIFLIKMFSCNVVKSYFMQTAIFLLFASFFLYFFTSCIFLIIQEKKNNPIELEY